MDTQEWLKAICSPSKNLACFISLLAELEAIGAHKIRCSIGDHGWGEEEKKHLGEESSHTLLFQKLLGELPYRPVAAEKEALRQIAHDYFDPLDHGTSDHLTALLGGYNPRLCYVLVSYLIECRALEVYEEVARLTSQEAVRQVFGKVIADEKGHLASMETALAQAFPKGREPFDREIFTPLEGKLYANLQRQLIEFVEGRDH